MKKHIKILSIIAGIAALGMASSQAGDKALLDTLVKKGFITAEEAKTIGGEGTTFAAKGKKTQKVKFNGRVQMQHNFFTGEFTDASGGATGTTIKQDTGTTNKFYLRRVYLGASADLENDFYGTINANFAGSAVELDKAIIGYKGFEGHKIEVGQQKRPFMYEETTSSSKLKAIERSPLNRAFIDDVTGTYFTGITAKGNIADTGLKYAIALTNAGNGDSDTASTMAANTQNQLAYTGRLQYKVKSDDMGTLLFGGDYLKEEANKTAAAGDVDAWTIYADYNYGNFNLLGVYGDLTQDDNRTTATSKNREFDGFAIMASYKFDKTWEPVIRYSHVEADANATNGLDASDLMRRFDDSTNGATGTKFTEADIWFVGMNWYLLGNEVKLQSGYEWGEIEDKSGGAGNGDKLENSGVRTMIQILF